MRQVRVGGGGGAARAHRPGLQELPLPDLRQAVQRALRNPAEPCPVTVRRRRPRGAWRPRYKLSLRDLPEMFAVRGIAFCHETVRDWEAKLTPALAERLRRRHKGKAGRNWHVDETYLKVGGRWCYVYRAIGGSSALADAMFSERRDMAAARAFFSSAKATTGTAPRPGHNGRPRQLPPGDPRRAGPGRAAPDRRLQEQSARTRPPGPQRAIPTHAGLRVPRIGRPVLPGPRRTARLPPPPVPLQPARSRPPPPLALPRPCRDGTGHPRNRLSDPGARPQGPYPLARVPTQPSVGEVPRIECDERPRHRRGGTVRLVRPRVGTARVGRHGTVPAPPASGHTTPRPRSAATSSGP